MTIRYVVISIVVISFITIGIIVYLTEKRNFNNGKCVCCGEKFELFDVDSQGGRGYKCTKCNRYLWISYRVDKKYKPIRRY